MKEYFGKDYKFYWRNETIIGNWYGVLLNRLGIKLLNIGRTLLRKGGGSFRGNYYSNCSWCGDVQTPMTGMHMSVSRKGSRCTREQPRCDKQPLV